MTQGMLCISKDVIYTYSEPSRCFLTVSIAPFVNSGNNYHIFKLFVKAPKDKMIEGAPKSKPASTTLSAKLRHGLAWHPSSLFVIDVFTYKPFAQK